MKSLRYLAAVCIVVLAAIFVQELAVGFAIPDFNPRNHLRFTPSTGSLPVLGPRNKHLRLIKNSGDYNVSVIFNQHGFRDSKDVSVATKNDVVVVGDSFAFGWGVEQDERVSEQLQGLIGRNVYNIAAPAGVLGYGKLLEYAKFVGADIRYVVVFFNMFGDIKDYDKLLEYGLRKTEKEEKKPIQLRLLDMKNYLIANSALYFLITNLITQNDYLRHLAIKAGFIIPLSTVAKSSINDKAIVSSVNHLKLITKGYEAIVVVVPNRGIWIGKNKSHERKIHAKFIRTLKNSGLRFIDMRKAQELGGNPMRFHFKNDGHWEPIGHKLAASRLAYQMIFKTENRRQIK